MKVVKVNIYKHDMQLKAPWAIAGRVMESVENIFIELTTEEGLIGLGSGANRRGTYWSRIWRSLARCCRRIS